MQPSIGFVSYEVGKFINTEDECILNISCYFDFQVTVTVTVAELLE